MSEQLNQCSKNGGLLLSFSLLRHLGKVVCPTVGQTTRGRLGREYWPNEKNARLTFSRQSRSLAPHVRNGRVGFHSSLVQRRSQAAPFWYAAFVMVGRNGRTYVLPVPLSWSVNPLLPGHPFHRGYRAETQIRGVQS
jgi:hypothetical protein